MSKEISETRVLVCDDSMMVRKSMRKLLTKYGIYDVCEAANGKEAVEKFVEASPDITFMDIVMPVMTGIEALKLIKASAPEAKIVMASSVGTQGNLTEAIRLGATDFLQKPVCEDELYKLLDTFLKEA